MIKEENIVVKPPALGALTAGVPELELIIQKRWIEAEKCQQVGAYLSAVIIMSSILEAARLARATVDKPEAYRNKRAPKKDGKLTPVQDWTLNQLIEVATEAGWLKLDRSKLSHLLREFRNVVHPSVHVATRADLDDATCTTFWHVVNASVNDLVNSLP